MVEHVPYKCIEFATDRSTMPATLESTATTTTTKSSPTGLAILEARVSSLLMAKYTALIDERDFLQSRLAKLEAELTERDDLKEKHDYLKTELEKQQSKTDTLQQDIGRLRIELQQKDKTVKSYTARCNEQQQTIKSQQDKLSASIDLTAYTKLDNGMKARVKELDNANAQIVLLNTTAEEAAEKISGPLKAAIQEGKIKASHLQGILDKL